MEEIQVFLDKELKNEVIDGNLKFGIVSAGKKSSKKIFVKNLTSFRLNLGFTLEGKNIILVKEIKVLFPYKVEEVVFELNPTITIMKPITASLKIKLDYVIS